MQVIFCLIQKTTPTLVSFAIVNFIEIKFLFRFLNLLCQCKGKKEQ